MTGDERLLWWFSAPVDDVRCVAVPGCGAVELRVTRGDQTSVREVFPDHSTLYERARQLRVEFDERLCRERGFPYLRTATCAVRPWRASDAEAVARHGNSPTIAPNLRDGFPAPFTLERAQAFIAANTARIPIDRFAIVTEGEAVGSIGFTQHTNVERTSAEVGYWLGEAARGRGVMTDALMAVTGYAIRTHGLTRVYAVPYENNPASFRVLEKAGYVCEGRMRRSVIKDGLVLDQVLYAFAVAVAGNPDTRLPG